MIHSHKQKDSYSFNLATRYKWIVHRIKTFLQSVTSLHFILHCKKKKSKDKRILYQTVTFILIACNSTKKMNEFHRFMADEYSVTSLFMLLILYHQISQTRSTAVNTPPPSSCTPSISPQRSINLTFITITHSPRKMQKKKKSSPYSCWETQSHKTQSGLCWRSRLPPVNQRSFLGWFIFIEQHCNT